MCSSSTGDDTFLVANADGKEVESDKYGMQVESGKYGDARLDDLEFSASLVNRTFDIDFSHAFSCLAYSEDCRYVCYMSLCKHNSSCKHSSMCKHSLMCKSANAIGSYVGNQIVNELDVTKNGANMCVCEVGKKKCECKTKENYEWISRDMVGLALRFACRLDRINGKYTRSRTFHCSS